MGLKNLAKHNAVGYGISHLVSKKTNFEMKFHFIFNRTLPPIQCYKCVLKCLLAGNQILAVIVTNGFRNQIMSLHMYLYICVRVFLLINHKNKMSSVNLMIKFGETSNQNSVKHSMTNKMIFAMILDQIGKREN